ncbi:putative 26S proteasome non-ATPase regulatory subunit 9 [Toxocara canis]|uniref:Putative 26S proteasome non-ATPase regulatory subunit 9 n=1 Tax=Toxocara canis TaxID=6265 RepID=A0A0B2VQL6_TOXCA|nr:putative 26S proteasome non-ATPase regulatory subunit 9 [Toxocara canis]
MATLEEVKKLIAQRDIIDKQIAEQEQILKERKRVPYVRKMATLEEVKKLIAQRDIIDKQIAEQEQILKENGVDMRSSLIDSEGFPLANVDVYSVRHARQAVICARNDRQKLNDRIEALMHELHAIAKQERPSSKSDSEGDESEQPVHRTSNHPFARVDKVSSMSPAQQAGLKDGDQILQFGSLHAATFNDMSQFTRIVQNSIGGLKDGDQILQFGSLHAATFNDMSQFTRIVQNSIGKKIRVTVLREGRAERLELIPQQWSGRGVLGCSVLPVTSAQVI